MVHLPIKVLRKYINAFSSYSAKTKRDGQTDKRTGGNCNISRPGPSARREIIIGGYRRCCYECSLSVYLVINNSSYVRSDALPLYNFKAIGQLVMEILHLKDFGHTESVITNAVVLVLGECKMSKATYLRGVSSLI